MDFNFEKLAKAVVKNKGNAVVDKEPDVLIVSFADLVYSITSDKTEAINFQTLGLDFMTDSTGNINLVEHEAGEITTHEIQDSALKDTLNSHLLWRTRVLETHGF